MVKAYFIAKMVGPAGQFGVLESVLSFILVGKVFGKTFRILGLLRWKEVFVGG